MTSRRTINDVVTYNQPLPPTQPIPTQNPPIPNLGAAYNNWQNQQNTFILNNQANQNQSLDIAQLRAENEKLRNAIQTWQTRKPTIEEEILEQSGVPNEFNKKIAYNEERIRDLQTQLREQEQVIAAYQTKFSEFEDNLSKLMRLDKDIHSKLVNPEQSTTLEKNVKNLMLALNSGASYEQVIGMIDNIRV